MGVDLIGVPGAVRAELVAMLRVKAGEPLDPSALRRDLLALANLEIADDISIASAGTNDGVEITYRLAPYARLDRVAIHGLDHAALRELRALAGGLANMGRIERIRLRTLELLRLDGYLDATLDMTRVAPGEICGIGSLGPRYVIDRLAIQGGAAIPHDELQRRLVGKLEVNRIGGTYDETALQDALAAIKQEYGDRGFIHAELGTPVVTVDRKRARISIQIAVHEGKRFMFGDVRFRGDPIDPAAATVLALASGATYSWRAVLAATARLRRWLENNKLEHRIDIGIEIDDAAGRIDLVIDVENGRTRRAR